MRGMFSLENPVMRFLSKMGDLILLNILFLLCCLPVFTIGAAVAGLSRATQSLALDQDRGVVRLFFRGFRENFRQATLTFLLLAVIALCLGANWLVVAPLLGEGLSTALKGVTALLGLLVLGVSVYLFPLLTRYENTMAAHVQNAMILAVVKLPRTAGLALLPLIPLLLAWLSPASILQLLPVFLLIGFGFLSYLSSLLLVPVFFELEGIDPDKGPAEPEDPWEMEESTVQ